MSTTSATITESHGPDAFIWPTFKEKSPQAAICRQLQNRYTRHLGDPEISFQLNAETFVNELIGELPEKLHSKYAQNLRCMTKAVIADFLEKNKRVHIRFDRLDRKAA